MPPSVVLVAPGDPLAVKTFSGISAGFVEALSSRGALAGAVDGRPRWLQRIEQVASVDLNRQRWQQRYYSGTSSLGPVVREAMSRVSRHRAESAAADSDADAVLQLTGWYRPTVEGALNASYHDGNLASFLQQPELRIDRESRWVRRAMSWEKHLYDETDVIFTMSSWLRDIFLEAFDQPPEKVVAVGAGSDLEVPTVDGQRAWDHPRFLFVGRDWERKGGPELLRAWPAVHAAQPDAELLLVGPREVQKELPPGVALHGRVDRASPEGEAAYADIYRRATAFVMPSLYEPFGIVLLEAMAFGLPCVAADRCAMPEIVDHGTTGRVVDPTDPDALASAMLELADPSQARQMGEAGRRRLVERFTWDAVVGRILDELDARIPFSH